MNTMKIPGMFKLTFWKAVAIVIITVGLAATIQRFAMGLGAVTNLRDNFPWGLWIGFDILVGVGLAAGGFVIAATVYVFNIERFRPILRPTILTAFLGYILVIVGLMVDLGRPWAIWHALIMWNPKSVMFEVAWCVMLYTTVLALEFSPIVFERFKMHLPLKILKAITIPLVITGVILSTLHQSSLGSLFLVIPTRMHPLWYSEIIPFLFIISCVAAGLAMTIVESFLSSRAFGREIEFPLLTDIARVIVVVLALYFTVRMQDLISRDALKYAFEISYQSILFFGEIVLGVVVPMVMLAFRRFRMSRGGLFFAAVFAVLGFIAHRVNVAVTSMEQWGTRTYVPSVQEFAISMALVAGGIVVFGLVARYFPVFEHEHEHGSAGVLKEGVTEPAPVPAE
jgi:Ni/Fe-hydrogenase subunit HybB-like protein